VCFPHVEAIQDVRAEVDSSIRALFDQLLATLHAQGKLPTFFRAVSFLRRMCILPERPLALAFLMGRLEALTPHSQTWKEVSTSMALTQVFL
jgi:hypothetical protein